MNTLPLIQFQDIVLRFTRQTYYADERIFQLQVQKSPFPLSSSAFQMPTESQLQKFQELFAQRLEMGQFFNRFTLPDALTPEADLADLGQALYALLPTTFQQSFPRVVQSIFEKGHGVRLILEAAAGDKASFLLGIPWEILFFETASTFPLRSPRVLIVRRLLEVVRRSAVHLQPPLNILHVIAHDPNSPPRYWITEPLQCAEQEKIQDSVAAGKYHLVARPGSVEQMLAALQQSPYHVLHFLGHGEIYSSELLPSHTERGYLCFISAEHTLQWVSGEQLQHLLEFSPTLQLVTLNACHGGANVARSVALELVYNGLPYVVAFQGEILQESAQYFIAAFYAALQAGSPLDYAVALGRAAIAAHLPQTMDWCLPVLYTNAGFDQPSRLAQAAEYLWHWQSSPPARYWWAGINLACGGALLLVSTLMLLSGQTVSLQPPPVLTWIMGITVFLPFLLTLVAYPQLRGFIPPAWTAANKTATLLRALASAAIGLGLPMLYVWLGFVLSVAVGLWSHLSALAQIILLGCLFMPGIGLSCLLSYSQMIGQARALISNAQATTAPRGWGDLFILIGGYFTLLVPLLLWLLAPLFPPPWANPLWGGVFLILGYVVWKESR